MQTRKNLTIGGSLDKGPNTVGDDLQGRCASRWLDGMSLRAQRSNLGFKFLTLLKPKPALLRCACNDGLPIKASDNLQLY